MRMLRLIAAAAVGAGLAACATTSSPPAAAPSTPPPTAAPQSAPAAHLSVPVEYHKLDNGLKVVLSPDHTSPTVAMGLYYGVGFRTEPKDRTGFAHLFEHLMFQGSQNLGKMEFIKTIQSNGGVLNGSTRFDFTNYIEVVPSHALQPLLWAEADRMKGLAITDENLKNQRDVVKNEVRVNVLNRPYGGFPWLDLPQAAFSNWYNAHNFYGDMTDLDAANLADVKQFFQTYYVPNNAALAITGDIDPVQTMAWVKQYFGGIKAAAQPARPDISEPRQTQEKRVSKDDAKATRPAIALGYQLPRVGTPEYYAMGMIDQILAEGKDSMLYQELVQRQGITDEVSASMNVLGNMFDINGPSLYEVWLMHDADKSNEQVLAAIDSQVEQLRTKPVDAATLDRARVKFRSQLYDELEGMFGLGRADLLASFALFDDAPQKINSIESDVAAVTPELIQRTAQEYLRPTNRTILTVVPKAAAQGEKK